MRVIVRFTANDAPYNAGETAGFTEDRARVYVEKMTAEIIEFVPEDGDDKATIERKQRELAESNAAAAAGGEGSESTDGKSTGTKSKRSGKKAAKKTPRQRKR